jgi:MFS family permease
MFLMMANSFNNVYVIEFAKERGIDGAGVFYTVLALALVVARPLSGWLTDRFGISKTIFPSMLLFALSFIVIGTSRSLPALLFGAVLTAVGFGATQPAAQAMCMQCELPARRAVASNTLYIGTDIGLFIGPVIGGFIKGISNYSTMFVVNSVTVAIAFVTAIIIMPLYNRRIKDLHG